MSGAHFFIVYKAKQLLPTIVSRVSDGKYTMTSAKLRFHYFSPSLMLIDAHLRPATRGMDEEYEVKVDSLYLSIESVLPILLNKAINVKEVRLVNPAVLIRRNVRKENDLADDLIHRRVNAMQRNVILVLNELSVNSCRVVNGSFRFYPFPGSERHYNLEHANLAIDDLVIPPYEGEATQGIEGRIRLQIRDPQLRIADSLLRVGMDDFVWDNQQRYMHVGNFQISQRSALSGTDSFLVALDTIRLRHVYWQTWLDSGLLRLDTLIANNGNMYFESSGRKIKRTSRDTSRNIRTAKVWDAIGNLEIDHFSARYIRAALINRHPGKERSNSVIGDSLVVQELSIRPDRKDPLQIGNLGLGVREFLDRGANTKFQSSFSRMHLRGDTMTLNNYLVQSTPRSRLGKGSSLFIPTLSIRGLSIEDLMNEKASVREVRMDDPELILYTNLKKQETGGIQLSTRALEEIRPYVDVERVVLNQAKFTIYSKDDPGVSLGTQSFSAVILSRAAMSARNMEEFASNIRDVELSRFFFVTPRMNMELINGAVDYPGRSVYFERATGTMGKKRVSANLYGVRLMGGDDLQPFDQKVLWHFRKLSVDSGQLGFLLDSAVSKAARDEEDLIGLVDSLDLRSLQVQLSRKDLHASARVERAQLEGHQVFPSRYTWSQARVLMHDLQIANQRIQVQSRTAEIISKGNSLLRDARVTLRNNKMEVDVHAPEIRMRTEMSEVLPHDILIEDIQVSDPVVDLKMRNRAEQEADTNRQEQRLQIRQFALSRPVFNLSWEGNKTASVLRTSGETVEGSRLVLQRKPDSALFTIDRFRSRLNGLAVMEGNDEVLKTGAISLDLEKFRKANGSTAAMDLNAFGIGRVDMHQALKKDTIEASTDGINLGRIPGLVLQKDSLLQTAFKIPPTKVLPGTFVLRSPANKFSIRNLMVDTEAELLAFDSLEVQNRVPRDSFFAHQPFEKDYITFSTGHVRADALRPVLYHGDTAVNVRKLTIDPMYFMVERDKRVPDDTIAYRPLMTRMLNRLPFLVEVDSIELRRSVIWHNVIDEKTEKEGTIFFTNVNGYLTNVKNYDLKGADSLRMSMQGRLMGKGEFRMQFREAYGDTAQGFLLAARMGGMEMAELNRLMIPLFNVRADRGTIKDLYMKVKGTDYLAFGSMVINYNRLKISLLNEENKRRKLMSWLANVFVRGQNSKTGIVYAERLREKSIFNFWARISVNGLLTNLGVRKNGKQVKKFYRGLEKHQLPPDLF